MVRTEKKKERQRKKWWAHAHVHSAHTIAFDLFHFTVLKRRKTQLTQIISHTLRHRQKWNETKRNEIKLQKKRVEWKKIYKVESYCYDFHFISLFSRKVIKNTLFNSKKTYWYNIQLSIYLANSWTTIFEFEWNCVMCRLCQSITVWYK